MKRNWRAAAFAAALCMALTATTGCAEKIDQTAGGNLITTTPVTEEATEAPTAAPELTERMQDLKDQAAFDNYVKTVESKNMITNPIDVKYGDDILTLSTCYSDEDNSRFLIVARRLREGEDTQTLLAKIQGGATEETTAAAQE